jgi:transducin (beta)-like 1
MDVDEREHDDMAAAAAGASGDGDGVPYPSPDGQTPPVALATNGPQASTQMEQTALLAPDTVFLTVADASARTNPVVLHCEWNPQDASILAVAGTDSLVRIWRSAGGPTPGHGAQPDGEPRPWYHQDIREEEAALNTSVTEFAWSNDGSAFAIASESVDADLARVSVWSADGTHLHTFTGLEPPLIPLKWSPANDLILAIGTAADDALITVFSVARQTSSHYSTPRRAGDDNPLDVVWTSDSNFILCGGDILRAFHFDSQGGTFSLLKRYETGEQHGLTAVTYDPLSGLIATSADSGHIDVSGAAARVMYC